MKSNGSTEGALAVDERLVPFTTLSKYTSVNLPEQLFDIITSQSAQTNLLSAYKESIKLGKPLGTTFDATKVAAPYYEPPKIWEIGLNYKEHAADLGTNLPDEPASFMKPRTTIIGHGESIILPSQSRRITAEAELGVIIGKRCKNVDEEEAGSVLFGYVPILDVTAEDVLQRNPRFLTRAKSFDTFFSFGPIILTPDEIKDVENLSVSTVFNGKAERTNKIHDMIFSLRKLVSFHSKVMTLEPGDILSTGTPGAVVIRNRDTECRIDGFPTLSDLVKGAA